MRYVVQAQGGRKGWIRLRCITRKRFALPDAGRFLPFWSGMMMMLIIIRRLEDVELIVIPVRR